MSATWGIPGPQGPDGEEGPAGPTGATGATGPAVTATVLGARDIGTSSVTRYLSVGYNSASAASTPQDHYVLRAHTVVQFAHHQATVGTGTVDLTIQLRKNGASVGDALTHSVSTQTGTLTLTTPVSYAVGDFKGMSLAKSGTLTSAGTDYLVTLLENA